MARNQARARVGADPQAEADPQEQDPQVGAAAQVEADPARNPMREFMTNVLGISNANVREAIMDQGIVDMTTFRFFKPEDIHNAIEVVRKPSGVIENPLRDQAGQQPYIPNRGLAVSNQVEISLKDARDFFEYLHYVQRDPLHEYGTIAIHKEYQEILSSINKVDNDKFPLPAPFNGTNSREVIEAFDDVLRQRRGLTGAPLAYLVRDTVIPPRSDGPGDLGLFNPSSEEEMIARTRHDGHKFREDNKTLFGYIRQLTTGTHMYSLIKRHSRSQDGRAAYLTLKGNCMGTAFQAMTAVEAETVLAKLHYSGTARNFPFEKFSDRLNAVFEDLAMANEGLNDIQKVRKLLERISDPLLAPAKCFVDGTPGYRDNFNRALEYIKEQQSKLRKDEPKASPTRRAAELKSGRGGGGGRGGPSRGKGGRGKGGRGHNKKYTQYDPNNPLRSLTPEAWKALPETTKQHIRNLRQNKGKRNASAVELGEPQDANRQRVTMADGTRTHDGPVTDSDPADGVGGSMTRRERR